MAGITERNQMKNELAGMGYSLRYIDEWQPKARLYRHKASYNIEGGFADAVGTYMDNVPGNPDYVLKKSKIGLFPWPPSEACNCKWCLGRRGPEAETAVAARAEGSGPPPVPPTASEGRGSKKFGPHLQQS